MKITEDEVGNKLEVIEFANNLSITSKDIENLKNINMSSNLMSAYFGVPHEVLEQ